MIDSLRHQEKFTEVFGTRPTVLASAPGRVNLIGEHTDYNGGFVLPAAIERHVLIAAAPSASGATRLYSVRHQELHSKDSARPLKPGSWPSYFLAVEDQFLRRGFSIPALDVLIDGDVPLGAGLSSSAAYGVAAAVLYNHVLKAELTSTDLAVLAQSAENGPLIGMRCGIMDQFISANGQEGKAVLLDCHTLDYRLVEFAKPSPLILIINSMKQRGLVESAYNERRSSCEESLRIFQEQCVEKPATLRHLTARQFDQYSHLLTPEQHRRVRHNLTENARVRDYAAAVESGGWAHAGKLLYESHESLRDDYEVSCPELDAIVEQARSTPGVYGCRMTGAGFGGCCMAMVDEAAIAPLKQGLATNYTPRFVLEPQFLVTRPSRGASVEPVQTRT